MDFALVLAHLRDGDWQRAHAIVQADDSLAARWAHGIVHLIEGDLDNARYWYARAGRRWPVAPDVAGEIEALARSVEPAESNGGTA
jgi:hypothetical protein